jgi:Na+/melibiose symporter-like transporter
MLIALFVFFALIFRWTVLEPLIGRKRMYLFDAVIFTVLSAMNFANPGTPPAVGYVVAVIGALIAISSGRAYQKFDNNAGETKNGSTNE